MALADASYADYLRRGSHRSDRELYPVALPGLTFEETLRLTRDLPVGKHHTVARIVHDFTAGHPGTTRALLSAIRQHPHEGTDLSALLGQRAGDQTVEESMLSPFLEGLPPEMVEGLTTCSAARHLEAAVRLRRWDPTASEADVFSDEFWWPDADGGPATLHPVFRRLLLRRLSRRADHCR